MKYDILYEVASKVCRAEPFDETEIDYHRRDIETFVGITNVRVVDFDDARIMQALDLAVKYGQKGGAHHKAWVIDQMVRVLAGDRYDELVKEHSAGDGPASYTWDRGIAP